MVILSDNPMSLANWHWFTCFRIETTGAIAEFSDHFVSTLPGLKVHGNPCASPGTPGGANILEYSSYGSKVPVNGPAESLIVLLNVLITIRVRERTSEHEIIDLLDVLQFCCIFEIDRRDSGENFASQKVVGIR